MYQHVNNLVTKIKHNRPLILNITNYVTMDFIANGLLSLGASPIISHSKQEISDLLKMADGVVINIGTLDNDFIALCEQVCHEANQLGIPITLDPVGAGASCFRTTTCLNLLTRFKISIIRGNASEIMALSGSYQNTKGVDTHIETLSALESAQFLSSHHHVVVAMSGKTDAIIDADHIQLFDRGSALMPLITGSGCLLSAVLSAFDCMAHNRYEAISAAVVFYSICGEIAARQANAPASFKIHFLDALSYLPERVDYENI